jgi:hypothetical protein
MALPLRDPQVLGVTVCALAKVAKVVIKIAGTLAAAAVMFLAIWLAIKAHFWALRQTVTHWRTSRAPARFRSSCRVPALWMSVTRTFTGRGFSRLSLLCVRELAACGLNRGEGLTMRLIRPSTGMWGAGQRIGELGQGRKVGAS